MILVPTSSDPFWSQTTSLDGTPYAMTFTYNQRAACFYLDLATFDGTRIASGMKLVCKWDLLLKCASPRRPPGKLIVFSNTTDLSTPGLLDLAPGARCMLVYLTVADLVAIATGAPLP